VPPQEFYGFAQSEFVAATRHTAGTAEDIMRVWKLLLDTVTPFAGRTPLRFRPRSFEHEFIEHTTRAAGGGRGPGGFQFYCVGREVRVTGSRGFRARLLSQRRSPGPCVHSNLSLRSKQECDKSVDTVLAGAEAFVAASVYAGRSPVIATAGTFEVHLPVGNLTC
jgi:hypothetical protein